MGCCTPHDHHTIFALLKSFTSIPQSKHAQVGTIAAGSLLIDLLHSGHFTPSINSHHLTLLFITFLNVCIVTISPTPSPDTWYHTSYTCTILYTAYVLPFVLLYQILRELHTEDSPMVYDIPFYLLP